VSGLSGPRGFEVALWRVVHLYHGSFEVSEDKKVGIGVHDPLYGAAFVSWFMGELGD